MSVAQTAKRRRRQMRAHYAHLAKLRRPHYKRPKATDKK